MIAQRFTEQVKKFAGNIALKTGDRSFTYRELNEEVRFTASEISKIDHAFPAGGRKQVAALLFEHGADMIIAVLGALTGGKIYVPLDVDYPIDRLLCMLEDSDSYLILTNSKNVRLAEELARNAKEKLQILNIDTIERNGSPPQTGSEPSADEIAYILYTSGSTGKPKGVMQTRKNVIYFIDYLTARCSITDSDRVSLFSAFCHDAAVVDIYASLLTGASLFPYDVKSEFNSRRVSRWLKDERITIWHSVPTVFRYFVNNLTAGERFPDLRAVLLGGEAVREHDLIMFRKFFPDSILVNIYGQTESTISSTWLVDKENLSNKVVIGEPPAGTEILITKEDGEVIEGLGVGEILVVSDHVSPGYWKDREYTDRVFLNDPEFGRMYRTGDLGRLMSDDSIEFVGRKDFQIKIRGFRVEPGEIETTLLKHDDIEEAVVFVKTQENADPRLCAAVVSNNEMETSQLRDYLSLYLPAYMIPVHFIRLDRMPLTPSNKIDRKRLTQLVSGKAEDQKCEKPADELEKKLARIWSGVLQVEEEDIGTDTGFFQLGGHSLNANVLILRIQKELEVAVPLSEMLNNPTIKGLSSFIKQAVKQEFASIAAVEKKEYYALSSAQKRMYILNRMDPAGTGYNIPYIMHLRNDIDIERLKKSFHRLTARQEILRTSFQVIGTELVQRIHDEPGFTIEVFEGGNSGSGENRGSSADLMKEFVRPFDLSQAPLFRVGLVKSAGGGYILLIDMHHIIADDRSQEILTGEISTIYAGEECPAMRIQYKDFSEWQNSDKGKEFIKSQETFWLKEFADQVPVLNLLVEDSPVSRDESTGDTERFSTTREVTKALKMLALNQGETLHMVLLSLVNVFLAKLTHQEDIIIGVPVAGRGHDDISRMPGMFVNMLAIRNYPSSGKTFKDFLKEVGSKTGEVFDNQDYPFENLVETVRGKGDVTPNPLFNVSFVFDSRGDSSRGYEVLGETDIDWLRKFISENIPPKYDLDLIVIDRGDQLYFTFHYSTRRFSRKTMAAFADYFRTILTAVLKDPGIEIRGIEIISAGQVNKIRADVQEVRESIRAEFDI